MWISIKKKNSFEPGPTHVFKLNASSIYLNTDIKKTTDQNIERNAFFAHPENIL